jgi:hypothetical protein
VAVVPRQNWIKLTDISDDRFLGEGLNGRRIERMIREALFGREEDVDGSWI